MNAKLLLSTFLALVLAVNARILDVWVPEITSPTSDTVWTSGEVVNVTWDTSDAPSEISNGALVTLDKNMYGTGIILAQNFDLRTGYVEITVPEVITDTDYEITLFGDSGNISDNFTINGFPNESSSSAAPEATAVKRAIFA